MNKIAIFASGSGTNAENIIRYFQQSELARVVLVASNKAEAGALERAHNLGVETLVFDRNTFYQTDQLIEHLRAKGINWVVLAGFLWLVPAPLIAAYPRRIINVHPALLPKFAGKGMYGDRVHRAVVEAGEHESGITIHYVNDQYDQGATIFQARCEVLSTDRAEDVAAKIHQLEQQHFPQVIERLLLERP